MIFKTLHPPGLYSLTALTLILLFSVSSLGLLSCEKDNYTKVDGVVRDKVTRAPLTNAYVEFVIYHSEVDPYNHSESQHVITDTNGNFSFQSYDPFDIYRVVKVGYYQKGVGSLVEPISQGKQNRVTIEMAPIDGFLKLNMENSTAAHDTIYVGVHSEMLEAELGLSYGFVIKKTVTVPVNTSRSLLIGLASGETVDIYWSFSPWAALPDISLSPGHGTANIIRGDTAVYNITY